MKIALGLGPNAKFGAIHAGGHKTARMSSDGNLRVQLYGVGPNSYLELFGEPGEMLGTLDYLARKVREVTGNMPKRLTAEDYNRVERLAGASGASWTQLAHMLLEQEDTIRQQDSQLADEQMTRLQYDDHVEELERKVHRLKRKVRKLRADAAPSPEQLYRIEYHKPDDCGGRTWVASMGYPGAYDETRAREIAGQLPGRHRMVPA